MPDCQRHHPGRQCTRWSPLSTIQRPVFADLITDSVRAPHGTLEILRLRSQTLAEPIFHSCRQCLWHPEWHGKQWPWMWVTTLRDNPPSRRHPASLLDAERCGSSPGGCCLDLRKVHPHRDLYAARWHWGLH